jgi:hypothetical protein
MTIRNLDQYKETDIRNLDQYKETDNRNNLADFFCEDLQLVKSAKIKVHLK